MKRKFLLTIAYDGTGYAGWQAQKDSRVKTVEGALRCACQRLFGDGVELVGCSRTDSGVHALGQRATIFCETRVPAEKIPEALNPFLPEDIAVLDAEMAPDEFHCRYDVVSKTYEYRFYCGRVRNPLFFRDSEFVRGKLDILSMQKAAEHFLGTHDFQAFCAAGSQVKSTIRTIFSLTVQEEGPIVRIRVCGDGFLYNMVRILAGTLLYVGQGKIDPAKIPEIIAGKKRKNAGKTAAAKGLCLLSIRYGEGKEIRENGKISLDTPGGM